MNSRPGNSSKSNDAYADTSGARNCSRCFATYETHVLCTRQGYTRYRCDPQWAETRHFRRKPFVGRYNDLIDSNNAPAGSPRLGVLGQTGLDSARIHHRNHAILQFRSGGKPSSVSSRASSF